MPLKKQAKILSPEQEHLVLGHIAKGRYPIRDRAMFLLSVKAGLRVKEISSLTWAMVTDAEGQIGASIGLTDAASKGGYGGRTIPLNDGLRAALADLQGTYLTQAPDSHVIRSERGGAFRPKAMVIKFMHLYAALGFTGASSHSGRRTFITRAARSVAAAGGSLRDVQELAGHGSLNTTQRYIQGDTVAKQRLVEFV